MIDETKWLADKELRPLLGYLCDTLGVQRTRQGRRRLRLFACACARSVEHLMPHDDCRRAVEVAERYADGLAGRDELAAAERLAYAWRGMPQPLPRFHAAAVAWRAAEPAPRLATLAGTHAALAFAGQALCDQAHVCGFLRDVFGNPFRRVVVERGLLRWNEDTIPRIAHGVYDERAFERLPVLADALEDAGCTSSALLDHCRGPGPHVRGCWAVDLLRNDA